MTSRIAITASGLRTLNTRCSRYPTAKSWITIRTDAQQHLPLLADPPQAGQADGQENQAVGAGQIQQIQIDYRLVFPWVSAPLSSGSARKRRSLELRGLVSSSSAAPPP